MPPFKHLLKNSWYFYKAHWKTLVLFFLPIEALILLLALALRFGFSPARFSWVAILAFIFGVIFILAKALRKIIVFSGGLLCDDLIEGRKMSWESGYKKILGQIWPILWVGILQCLIALVFAVLSAIIAVIVFASPFLVISFIVKANPAALLFFTLHGGSISFYSLIVALLVFVASSVWLISSVWFSSYALLLEGRRGIDAIATSASLVRGKRRQIFWRLLLIGLIALIPVLIILGPVYLKIIAEALPQMLIGLLLYTKFNVLPVLPHISSSLFVWRVVLTSVACLVAVPIFIALNYFLWKDVKATAPAFEEKQYTKTHKRMKIWAWTGAVLFAIGPVVAVLGRIVSVFAR